MNIFSQMINAKNLKTYSVGLLQTKAYKELKARTEVCLKPYGMSNVEWAYIGTVSEYPKGIRSTDLADILGVEAPFITALSAKFHKRKLIEYQKDPTDKRAKCIVATAAGKSLVKEIEVILRQESKKWLSDVSIRDVLTYIKVLKKITEK